LSSQVFEQTDYQGYAPLAKIFTTVQNDDPNVSSVPSSKGRKVNEAFRDGVKQQEKVNLNYDPKSRADQILQGNYLKTDAAQVSFKTYAPPTPSTVKVVDVSGHETRATKQAMLSSNNFVTGNSSLEHYTSAKNAAPQVVDLVIGNLPPTTEAHTLKRISGSKHVINATVEEDNFRGVCTGNGRLQIRLNHGETVDSVKLNFVRLGYSVNEFTQDPRKKPIVTGLPRDSAKELADHRIEKQNFLQTQNPDVFGNTQRFYA